MGSVTISTSTGKLKDRFSHVELWLIQKQRHDIGTEVASDDHLELAGHARVREVGCYGAETLSRSRGREW